VKNRSKDNEVRKTNGNKTQEVVKITSIEEEMVKGRTIASSVTIEIMVVAIKSSLSERTRRMTMTSSSPLMGQIDQNQIEANGEVPQEVEITIKELSVSRKIPILDHLMHLRLTICSNLGLRLIMKKTSIQGNKEAEEAEVKVGKDREVVVMKVIIELDSVAVEGGVTVTTMLDSKLTMIQNTPLRIL
jgi:hypothetical protein